MSPAWTDCEISSTGLMGLHYAFGAWWPNWLYEYRKDFVTYWLLLVCILAFRLYGLWQDSVSLPPRPATGAGRNEPSD